MKTTSQTITSNNRVQLFFDGASTLSAIKDTLCKAERNINLEYFLMSDDATGREIAEILSERAGKGVNVRVILDAAGSWRLSRSFISRLEASGVQVQKFMPLRLCNLHELVHRDHRKIITADGMTGLLGGFNIGDVYLSQWRDTHLMLKGEGVRVLDDIFMEMWRKSGGADYESERVCESECKGVSDGVKVKILAEAIEDEYIRVIERAKTRVWITTPYLVPNVKFLEALYLAAGREVDVRIIIPSKSNHVLASWASQSYVDGLIRHGIRVFVYRDRFIHAKTLIADEHTASVGTANIDALSMRINYEVQAFIYDEAVVRELEGVFIEDLGHCTEESIECRRHRGVVQRVKELTGRVLSPLL